MAVEVEVQGGALVGMQGQACILVCRWHFPTLYSYVGGLKCLQSHGPRSLGLKHHNLTPPHLKDPHSGNIPLVVGSQRTDSGNPLRPQQGA